MKKPLITKEAVEKEISRLKNVLHENRLELLRAELEGIYVLLEEIKEMLSPQSNSEALKIERTLKDTLLGVPSK